MTEKREPVRVFWANIDMNEDGKRPFNMRVWAWDDARAWFTVETGGLSFTYHGPAAAMRDLGQALIGAAEAAEAAAAAR